jgi:hypothetical protein
MKWGEVIYVQIGEADLTDIGILQQIERAGRALQPCAENEHPHPVFSTTVV